MQVYLVRLHDEQARAREIVGIYAAEGMQQLCDMVDEAANVSDCEFLELGSGGIYWPQFTGFSVPRAEEPDWEKVPDDWSDVPPSPSLTESWSKVFHAEDVESLGEWERLDWPAADLET